MIRIVTFLIFITSSTSFAQNAIAVQQDVILHITSLLDNSVIEHKKTKLHFDKKLILLKNNNKVHNFKAAMKNIALKENFSYTEKSGNDIEIISQFKPEFVKSFIEERSSLAAENRYRLH